MQEDQMPTIIDGKVRLNELEKRILECLADQPINPQTAADLNAWIDVVCEPSLDDTPEEKLMKSMANDMRITLGNPKVTRLSLITCPP
jgi:hypothetical protein